VHLGQQVAQQPDEAVEDFGAGGSFSRNERRKYARRSGWAAMVWAKASASASAVGLEWSECAVNGAVNTSTMSSSIAAFSRSLDPK
jgi:hypothetical protein